MCKCLKAFQDSSVDIELILLCGHSEGDSLPMGFIVWPPTVRGVTREGSWLSLWSPSSSTMSVPAMEMSAPGSGRALMVAEPFGLAMCTLMVGADSMCRDTGVFCSTWASPRGGDRHCSG